MKTFCITLILTSASLNLSPVLACGDEDEIDTMAQRSTPVQNGITHNRMSFNRMSFNALGGNGITLNGLERGSLVKKSPLKTANDE